MAQQTINVGASANSGGGDPLRDALIKVNANFTEVYADIAALQDGSITTNITGDVKGSVFADDSTLLVDGVAGKIVGNIETTVATITNGLTLQNIYAQNAFGVNITVNGFNNLVVTQAEVTIQNVALNPTAGITGYISIADLQTLVAASTDFGDFQTRIAAL